MTFWLKKAVSYWLMPLPFCLGLLIAGLWLTRSARHARLGRRLLGTAVLLLLIFGNRTISTWLIQPLESVYPSMPEFAVGTPLPPELAGCRFVVVLGSGHGDREDLPATNQLSEAAHARIVEAVRLLRVLPNATLVTSGPGEPGKPSHAAVLAQAAASLGASPARFVKIDTVRDTEDESREIKKIVGEASFALVTSAWHMPRSMLLMRRASLHAVACPTHYAAHRPAPHEWGDALWDVDSLSRSTWAVHEGLGLLWCWLKKPF